MTKQNVVDEEMLCADVRMNLDGLCICRSHHCVVRKPQTHTWTHTHTRTLTAITAEIKHTNTTTMTANTRTQHNS